MTSQPLATADLHILEPRNPFPPHTTIFLADMFCVGSGELGVNLDIMKKSNLVELAELGLKKGDGVFLQRKST